MTGNHSNWAFKCSVEFVTQMQGTITDLHFENNIFCLSTRHNRIFQYVVSTFYAQLSGLVVDECLSNLTSDSRTVEIGWKS